MANFAQSATWTARQRPTAPQRRLLHWKRVTVCTLQPYQCTKMRSL